MRLLLGIFVAMGMLVLAMIYIGEPSTVKDFIIWGIASTIIVSAIYIGFLWEIIGNPPPEEGNGEAEANGQEKCLQIVTELASGKISPRQLSIRLDMSLDQINDALAILRDRGIAEPQISLKFRTREFTPEQTPWGLITKSS